jgi:hypothetical protein
MGPAAHRVSNAVEAVVITDSGGIQEETTHLAVPGLMLREAGKRRRELCRRFGTDTQGNASQMFWSGGRRDSELRFEYRHPQSREARLSAKQWDQVGKK